MTPTDLGDLKRGLLSRVDDAIRYGNKLAEDDLEIIRRIVARATPEVLESVNKDFQAHQSLKG